MKALRVLRVDCIEKWPDKTRARPDVKLHKETDRSPVTVQGVTVRLFSCGLLGLGLGFWNQGSGSCLSMRHEAQRVGSPMSHLGAETGGLDLPSTTDGHEG